MNAPLCLDACACSCVLFIGLVEGDPCNVQSHLHYGTCVLILPSLSFIRLHCFSSKLTLSSFPLLATGHAQFHQPVLGFGVST